MHLERLLKQQRQLDRGSQRILEINPRHALVQALAAQVGKDGAGAVVEDVAWLLLDQARLIEGEPLPAASAFSRRPSSLLERCLCGETFSRAGPPRARRARTSKSR